MIEFLQEAGIGQLIGAGSGAAIIINVLLKKLNLTEKIEKFFAWIGKKLAGFKEIAFQIGYNFGILLTTYVKKIPVVGIIWDNGIEPLVILILQLANNIVIATAGLLIVLLEGVAEGVKSDNNELKTKTEEK